VGGDDFPVNEGVGGGHYGIIRNRYVKFRNAASFRLKYAPASGSASRSRK
jgi:hypothetical protein